jgi:hypothetical protein
MPTANFYHAWNFQENPFSPLPLNADPIGNRLLIGREAELREVSIRLASSGGAVCLDGPVGVGKTSLANIAAYRAQCDYLADRATHALLIPCHHSFQVSNSDTPEEFRLRVLIEVAQTLLSKASEFRLGLDMPGRAGLDAWLNSPLLSQWNLGLPAFNLGGGRQTNESTGYAESGFARTVTTWLEQIFPTDRVGGVVCVLDKH